jgi:hypothetical protein
MSRTLQTLGLIGALSLAGCGNEDLKQTYNTVEPSNGKYLIRQGFVDNDRQETIGVQAWRDTKGKHLLIYNPEKEDEFIHATDFPGGDRWEDIEIHFESYGSPVENYKTAEKLDEVWKKINETQRGGRR